jgi:hypothetical protein
LVGKSEGRRSFGRNRGRMEYDIRMHLREMGSCELASYD